MTSFEAYLPLEAPYKLKFRRSFLVFFCESILVLLRNSDWGMQLQDETT